jgi:putative SOS response-associated peptidase YedK
MCGRYRRTTREEELVRIYRIPIPSQPDLPINYNIAPSQEVLSIRLNPETKQRSLDRLLWGLVRIGPRTKKSASKQSMRELRRLALLIRFVAPSKNGGA